MQASLIEKLAILVSVAGRQLQQPPRHRRRGEELETALLDAAWDELADVGFARLTMESVASRAKTGVAVLYRRWPRKDDLVMAAIGNYGRRYPVDIKDTGSLRGDMLALLTDIGAARTVFTTVVSAAFSGLLADSGLTPAEVRARLITDRPIWSQQIYRRAQERGEIDVGAIPEAVLAMPFDLMRHDLLMTLKPISAERVRSIVDDLFIPLITLYGGGR
jgi:AcrR family transcriptional regulator